MVRPFWIQETISCRIRMKSDPQSSSTVNVTSSSVGLFHTSLLTTRGRPHLGSLRLLRSRTPGKPRDLGVFRDPHRDRYYPGVPVYKNIFNIFHEIDFSQFSWLFTGPSLGDPGPIPLRLNPSDKPKSLYINVRAPWRYIPVPVPVPVAPHPYRRSV